MQLRPFARSVAQDGESAGVRTWIPSSKFSVGKQLSATSLGTWRFFIYKNRWPKASGFCCLALECFVDLCWLKAFSERELTTSLETSTCWDETSDDDVLHEAGELVV
jgi:hypothetical protein